MTKPSTPAVWASGKSFGFTPSLSQQAQGFDYIATVRPSTGAPITDDHDWPLNSITSALKWVMDQLPNGGIQELLTAILPKRSFLTDDYVRIPDVPDGLIIQWGFATTSASSDVTVNYPYAFPKKAVTCYVSPAATGSGVFANHNSFGANLANFKISAWTSTETRTSAPCFWLAIGN